MACLRTIPPLPSYSSLLFSFLRYSRHRLPTATPSAAGTSSFLFLQRRHHPQQHRFQPHPLPSCVQIVNGVKRGGSQIGVRERRATKPALRTYTEVPILEQELPEMDKKEKPAGPKQLSLRNTMAHNNSTISFVQILGTGMDTGDTSPCVLLFFDQRRFIFNAGEGLQRFCIEHKIKLSKIDHVFLTRVCSETAGGLPGLLLTLAGIGESGMAVNIWGPSDLQYFVDAMRTFVPNASVVHTHSFGGLVGDAPCASEGPGAQVERSAQVLLEDDVVKISAILLRPEMSGLDDSSGTRAKKSSKRPRVEQSATGQPPSDDQGDLSVVYVCELPEVKGRFDLKKAEMFFTRPGPHYGMLQAGKSVMASDGVTMVHPSDVMGPSSPGPIFILVDCPSAAYLPALLSNLELRSFQERRAEVPFKQVTLIVHISPASVTQLSEYQGWMSQFAGTQHVMAGHGTLNMSQPILKSSARVVSRLNLICPQVFSVSSLQPSSHLTDASAQRDPKEIEARPQLVSVAENLLRFRLRPLAGLGLDRSAVPEPFSMTEVQDQVAQDMPEVVEASKKIADLWRISFSRSDTIYKEESVFRGTDRELKVDMHYVEEPWLAGNTSSRSHSADISVNPSDGMEGLVEQHSSETEAGVLDSEFHSQENYNQEDIPACLQGVSREEMEMVFLGTGSSQPSKYRNVSSIYIHLFQQGGVILDCGEGTYAQLKRRYGAEGADEVLAGLKCVWISHIHADHHTGVARILSARKAILESREKFVPILVVGPKQLKRFLDAYGQLEDLGIEFLDCSQTTADADDIAASESNPFKDGGKDMISESPRSGGSSTGRIADGVMSEGLGLRTRAGVGLVRKTSLDSGGLSPKKGQLRNYWLLPGANLQAGIDWNGREKLRQILTSIGLSRLTSVPVLHCAHAFGVVIESEPRMQPGGAERPGWKVVYSGDTRPCKALVDASQGATVLIHEATFDDGMPEEALAKKHSLTREAIETGVSAGVYRTILTHFSQRYPKIPVFDDSYTSRTCIAFDMMSANLADLPLLPSLLPALKLLFKDDMMAVEEGGEDPLICD